MHSDVRAFVRQIARMTTEEEHGDEGMSGDDAVETLTSLIEEARELVRLGRLEVRS